MKKLYKIIGFLFIIFGILTFFILSFILTITPGESFSRDLIGLPVHNPPLWISYIPYVGSFFAFIFEFFSIHGLVEFLIIFIFISIGGFFLNIGDDKYEKN